ncbi:MAG: UvrD-helicase domain-containing protein [Bdellovibrionaceae bacterium]|nr:UvrD-helicase domain-containing protein [Pseudobdellovibrionaceae bacterium]MBX3035193.1 UvrD-helicase domain-containing protein [Pseudobdellovibrionaceae bacterium]
MSNRWLQGLNPEQREAVLHDHGPLLILAGAGSGKTTVLVSRTGRLIEERIAPAAGILVLTFTNKAAKELKHRVSAKLGDSAKGLWAGTFHSFGLFLLKKYSEQAGLHPRFSIIDASDAVSILKDLMKDVKVSGKDRFDSDRLLNLVNDIRSGQAKKHEGTDEYHELAEALAPKFEKRLELLGVVDFEALLLKPMELFKNHPDIRDRVRQQFQQVMVDEFQDTNRLQMKLIESLVGDQRNIAVVGDDDQSIYGWRGAQVSNILNFPSEYKGCKVVKLERNYRSSANILKLANEVIARNQSRHGKVLKPEGAAGLGEMPELFVLENEDEESEFVAAELKRAHEAGFQWKEMAVLYRSNTQGGLIESSLRRNRIEYSISGGTSIFDRKEAKDVMAYLRAAVSPNDIAFRRILNVPSRGVGDTSLERLADFSKNLKISFIEAAKQWQMAGLHDKAGEGIEALFQSLKDLPRLVLESPGTPGEALVKFFADIGYRQEVMASATQPGAGEKKWAVVEITGRILDSYVAKRTRTKETLRDFLDAMTLRDDDEEEREKNQVSLMTFHASKGLEFPYVILAGIEEDLLPHRSLGSDHDEERRLFYVGLTRAKQRLVLCRCQTRKRHGAQRAVAPSRFLLDIPQGLFQQHQGAYRPVTASERDDLVSGFLAKLQARGPAPKI